MSYRRTEARTAYIEGAKLHAGAKFNLAASGVKGLGLGELPVRMEELELSAPGGYGYPPLLERLAARYGVSTRNVVTAIGTSMANYLAMSAVLEPGDEVVIEDPAYDPMVEVGHYLGAAVKRIPRRPENKFQIDVDELKKIVSSKTRLIVLTNLHNPSGALLGELALREIGDVARNVAAPDLCERMWHHNDLFGNIPAHVTDRLSVMALDHLEKFRARAKELLQRNWKLLDAFLAEDPELEVVRPPGGTIVFAKVPR